MFRIVQQARPSAQEFLAGIESLDWTAQITANNIKKKETCWITIRMCCILTCMKQDYSSTHPPDWTHMVIINAPKKRVIFSLLSSQGNFCTSSVPRNHICCWEIEISRLKFVYIESSQRKFCSNKVARQHLGKKEIKINSLLASKMLSTGD